MTRRDSISRRNSVSSTHSRHESIGPEVARQHAHLAASLAFARGQDRTCAEMGDSSNKHLERRSMHQQNTENRPQPALRRQQSVRFAGPHSIQRQSSIGAPTTQNAVQRKPSTADLQPMAMTTNTAVPAEYRPPSRSSSIGKGSWGHKTTDPVVLRARAGYDAYYAQLAEQAQQDAIVSSPSSYRKIRRSKSMFSPRKGPHVFYANGSPDRTESSYKEQSTADSQSPQSQAHKAPLRAPKSMSFLRSRMSTGFRERNDEAVQMARDRFFHSATQQRLREQPSFLPKYRAPKREKSFRQTVRSSSANSYGMSVASKNQPPSPKESILKDKARRVSKSLKNKLKRALGFNKNEPVVIPNQQVDARETHFQQFDCDVSGGQETSSDIPHPDAATLASMASRVPSICITASNEKLDTHNNSVRSFRITGSSEKLDTHNNSVRSLGSEHRDDRSRVSSWTDCSVPSTTPSRKFTEEDKEYMRFCIDHPGNGPLAYSAFEKRVASERERQRLSVINENGTHVPSSSLNRSKGPNQLSAYPVILRPTIGVPQMASVESARVYSALMKRLEDNSPEKKLAAARLAALEKQQQESIAAAKQIPARTSSVHSSRGTPITVRQVPPSEATSSGKSLESAKHHQSGKPDPYATKPNNRAEQVKTQPDQRASTDRIRQSLAKNEDDVFSPKVIPVEKPTHCVYQGKVYLNYVDNPSSKKPSSTPRKSTKLWQEGDPISPKQIAHLEANGIGIKFNTQQRAVLEETKRFLVDETKKALLDEAKKKKARREELKKAAASKKSASSPSSSGLSPQGSDNSGVSRFSSKQLACVSALIESLGIEYPPEKIAEYIEATKTASSPSGSGISHQGSDSSNITGNSGKSSKRSGISGIISKQFAHFTQFKTRGLGSKLTPQQIAHINEPDLPRPPQRMPPKAGRNGLRESKSTFFAGGTTVVGRAPSPFRLAMTQENLKSPTVKGEEYDQKLLTPNPLFRGHRNISDTPGSCKSGSEVVYSESVYSRSTGGRSYARNGSNLSLVPNSPCIPEVPLTNSPKGEAVVVERAIYRPTENGPHVTRSEESQVPGSPEWRKWMSSEIERLVYPKMAEKDRPKKCLWPSHVRESAQITDDDNEIARRTSEPVKQPLGLVQQNPNIQNQPLLKPILKNRSAVSLLENINPANAGKPPVPPPPPPIPVRSPPRTVQSRASLRSVGTPRNVLHKRNVSNSTLRSTKSISHMDRVESVLKKRRERVASVSSG